ncbi:Transmembrane_domain-containing protein [Hexamita inflata]|uniref:Transmembrane_domain-containing protein n=1 Tax=Hexamita inflata TaxID=28002 RepID=A0ABP1GSD7_9EUKA
MRFTQNFIAASYINYSQTKFIIFQIILFLQSLSPIARISSIQSDQIIKLISWISLTFPNYQQSVTLKSQFALMVVFDLYYFLITMICMMYMFVKKATPKLTSNVLQLQLVSFSLLMIPLANINKDIIFDRLNMDDTICQMLSCNNNTILIYIIKALFIVLAILTILSQIIICYSFGQDNFYHQSVQITNGKLFFTTNMFNLFKFWLLFNIRSQSLRVGYYICQGISLIGKYMYPLYTCLTVLPISLGLSCISLVLTICILETQNVNQFTIGQLIIISLISFTIAFFLIQIRLKNVIDNSITWLIVRRNNTMKQVANEFFDIDYTYIAPAWFIQVFVLIVKIVQFPFYAIESISGQFKPSLEVWNIIKAKLSIKFQIDEKYATSLFISRLMQQNNMSIVDFILYWDFKRQMNKREKYINGLSTKMQNNIKFKPKITFISALDFSFAGTYIAKQYVTYHMHKMIKGSLLPVSGQRDSIDIPYLKHLEQIAQARFPSSKEIKMSYAIILANYLNDMTRAEMQLQTDIEFNEINGSKEYFIQIEKNQTIIRSIQGNLLNQENIIKTSKQVENNRYYQKVLNRITFQIQYSSQYDTYNSLNQKWDELDTQFCNLWNFQEDAEIYFHQIQEYRENYDEFMQQIQDAKQQSNNMVLYDLYKFAAIRYFQIEAKNSGLLKEYEIFKNRYVEGQNIMLDTDNNFVVVNHYQPSILQTKLLYGIKPQIVILSQSLQSKQYLNDAVQPLQIKTAQQVITFGPTTQSLNKQTIQIRKNGIRMRQIPFTSKQASQFIFWQYILLLFVQIFVTISLTSLLKYQPDDNNNNQYIFNLQMQSLGQAVQLSNQIDPNQYLATNQTFQLLSKNEKMIHKFYLINDQTQPRINLIDNASTYNTIVNQIYYTINKLVQTLPNGSLELYAKFKQLFNTFVQEVMKTQHAYNNKNVILWAIFIVAFILPIITLFVIISVYSFMVRDISFVKQLLIKIPQSLKDRVKTSYLHQFQLRRRFATIHKENIFQYLDTVIANNYLDAETLQDRNEQPEDNYTSPVQYSIQIPQHKAKQTVFSKIIGLNLILLVFTIVIFIVNTIILHDHSVFAQNISGFEQNHLKFKKQLQLMGSQNIKSNYLFSYFKTGNNQSFQKYLELNQTSFELQYEQLQTLYNSLDIENQIQTTEFISKAMNNLKILENIRTMSIAINNATTNLIKLKEIVDSYNLIDLSNTTCQRANIIMQNFNLTDPQQLLSSCTVDYFTQLSMYQIGYIIHSLDRQSSTLIFNNIQKTYSILRKPLIKQLSKMSISSNDNYLKAHNYQFSARLQYSNSKQYTNIQLDQYDKNFLNNISKNINLDQYKSVHIVQVFQEACTQIITTNLVVSVLLMFIVSINILSVKQQVNKNYTSRNYHTINKNDIKQQGYFLLFVLICFIVQLVSCVKIRYDINLNIKEKSVRSSQSIQYLQEMLYDSQKLVIQLDPLKYSNSVLNNTLINLYKYYSLYAIGKDQHAIPIQDIYNQFDYNQHIVGNIMMNPLLFKQKQTILQYILDIYQINNIDNTRQYYY